MHAARVTALLACYPVCYCHLLLPPATFAVAACFANTCYICCRRLLCEHQARGHSGLEAILGRVWAIRLWPVWDPTTSWPRKQPEIKIWLVQRFEPSSFQNVHFCLIWPVFLAKPVTVILVLCSAILFYDPIKSSTKNQNMADTKVQNWMLWKCAFPARWFVSFFLGFGIPY